MKHTIPIVAVIFTIGFVTLPIVWGDDDYRWGEENEYRHRLNDVATISNPVYREECGSCHMAYPPGLLPARSWDKLMLELDNHFGDNAEVDPETHRIITQFLLKNSADKSDYRRSKKFSRSIHYSEVPLRITDTPYFRHEHNEIPRRLLVTDTGANILSQCDACHKKAEQGSFNEHDVRIPGYGYWDD